MQIITIAMTQPDTISETVLMKFITVSFDTLNGQKKILTTPKCVDK